MLTLFPGNSKSLRYEASKIPYTGTAFQIYFIRVYFIKNGKNGDYSRKLAITLFGLFNKKTIGMVGFSRLFFNLTGQW